jgi:membrane-bound serine protease (ClpP class)
VLIFGGMFLELKSPGHGLSGVVALIAAFLFFVPHYVQGLAESWEIAVFLLGVILIAVEIFVIPGFGFTGILGIILAVVGVAAALLANRGVSLEYVTLPDLLRAVAMVLVMLSTAIILVIWLAKYLIANRRGYPYVDESVQAKEDGFTALKNEFLELIGQEGEAATDLRPVGFIHIGGKKFDAQAKEGYITKGQKVVVDRVTSVHLIVRKILAE